MTWIEDKQRATEAYFTTINLCNLELFRNIKLHFDKVEPILPLIEFIIERFETVTVLTMDDRIWDAEIVLRSGLETFVKLLFITTADKVEQEKRIDEFWNQLAEVNLIKQSEQAKKNLKHLGQLEIHNLANMPLLLSVEREKELREKWTKVERHKLEQKWSFSEIVSSLSKNFRGKPLEMFETISHGYRMSSHVTHGDETGILIIRERNSRPEADRDLAYFGHYLRLLSDVSCYCSLVGIETMNFLGLKTDFFFENQATLNDIQELTEKYHNDLFSDKDYDKFRKETIDKKEMP